MHFPAGKPTTSSQVISSNFTDADTKLKFRRHKPVWNESSSDEPSAGQRYSTWPFIEKGMRGPQPYPLWLIEDAAAMDTELGILKTGKEGDVFLLERATEERSSLLAAKRYRSRDHLQFSRSQAYSDGRSARRSRDKRAISNNSAYGRDIAALQWANAEWTYLLRCYEAGIPVPYPVQIDGTEILMEFIADPDNPLAAAPRLQQLARFDPRLPALWDQLTDALEKFAGMGIAHGDLSAYNLLVSGERLVVIDVPQCVDLAGNPQGMDFLHRDCVNLCEWFDSKGLPQDPDELFASLLGHLF
ncbi:serine/threonine protein kinase [Glutamicibacter sp. JL.03c]|uniref:serine protein kinase RIO n=1 Tax=Glutamicibacter sp. JL.03c TaxID=2984842 RepID=UPI0021F6E06A|nr:RIO1 family regulatory kinase/ATPase [Glutamicibacter sp. JL.03c]UYQ76686.1 serine/threonine protein kinase [Glutamicibacter sp. JL.03c]